MDRKSIIIIVFCFVLMLLWSSVIVPKLYPPKPLPPGATNLVAETQEVEATNASIASANPMVSPASAEVPTGGLKLNVNTNVPEQLLVVSNDNARYTFTSYGGGLKLVELLHYPETATPRHTEGLASHRVATLNTESPLPSLAVLDGPGVEGDGIFQLTRTADGVRAEKTLTNGLVLIKEFSLSTNYLVNVSVRLENHSTAPLSLPPQNWVVGTATPINLLDNGYAEEMMWYNGSKARSVAIRYFNTNTTAFFFFPRTPKTEYTAGSSNVFWASAQNQYFALVAMPRTPAPEVTARMIFLPPPSPEAIQENPRANTHPQGCETALVYPALTLAPRQSVEHRFVLFAGPKEYRTLARIADRFHNNVDSVMGYTGFFGFFSKGLLLGMNWLHEFFRIPYGWAIITITVIIKLLFWPLTQASTRSMKRMQQLQPQMKAIQEKYKDDPAKMNRKVMEFMKENKVSPLGGCLPMLLQMPVFLGFFYMIRSAIELRGASFLWVRDLSQPDTLFIIPGTNFPFNLLPLIMGASMLWQSHLTPPSPGVDPTQQKIMRYMPLIFLVFLYNYSSGLALYWTVSNLLTIAQTKLTRIQQAPAPAPVLTAPQKKRK